MLGIVDCPLNKAVIANAATGYRQSLSLLRLIDIVRAKADVLWRLVVLVAV